MAVLLVLAACQVYFEELARKDAERAARDAPSASAPSARLELPALKVVGLQVQHYVTDVDPGKGRGSRPPQALGEKSFVTWLDDSVTIEAKLPRPAYAYLIAYRPDGTEELLFPESEDQPPPLTDRPKYPSVSRGVNYGLEEGTGFAVFAVVASSRPLPAYHTWRNGLGESPWGRFESPPGVVWVDDGEDVKPLTADEAPGQRGKDKAVQGKTELATLTDWLRKVPEIEAVRAVGFTVLPRKAP
jgi:hypothetical protein